MCAALISAAGGATAEESDPAALSVVITAKFTLPQVSQPIAGSHEAVISAARKSEGTARLLTQAEWEALKLDWATLMSHADTVWKECAPLQPELIRDARGVLECAIIRSKEPSADLTGVVFAPEFRKHYAPMFGSKMLVAMPDRRTLFLFPRLASRYPDYAARVLTVYHAADQPVSREVYEVSADGLRAIGAYEEP